MNILKISQTICFWTDDIFNCLKLDINLQSLYFASHNEGLALRKQISQNNESKNYVVLLTSWLDYNKVKLMTSQWIGNEEMA